MLKRDGQIYLEDVRSLIKGMVELQTRDAAKRKALCNYWYSKCAANVTTKKMPVRLDKTLQKITTCVDILSGEEKAKKQQQKQRLNEQAFVDSKKRPEWKSAIVELKKEAASYCVDSYAERKDAWFGQEVRLHIVTIDTIHYLQEQLIAKMVSKVESDPVLQHRICKHFHLLLRNESAKEMIPASLATHLSFIECS